MDSAKVTFEDDELQRLIESRCRKVCIAKIRELIGAGLSKESCDDPPLPPNKYLSFFIDHAVNNTIDFHLNQFKDFHSSFETYNELKPQMPELFHSILATSIESSSRKSSDDFSTKYAALVAIWDIRVAIRNINDVPIQALNKLYAEDNEIPIIDEITYCSESKLIAERLVHDATEAIKYFGITLDISFSSDTIQKIIVSYQDTVNLFDLTQLWDYFKNYTEQIYYAILLINLNRIVLHIQPKLLESTRLFVNTTTNDSPEL